MELPAFCARTRGAKSKICNGRNRMPAATISHPALGALTFDPLIKCYASRRTFDNREVSFHIAPDGDPEIPGAFDGSLRRASAVCANLPQLVRRGKEFAAENLLELKNEAWIDEEEEPVTAEQFMQLMTLEGFSCESDGTVIFYFEDGDLFWGHCIEVRMDASDCFDYAEISG